MKLEVFDYIESACKVLNAEQHNLLEAAKEISGFLDKILEGNDEVLGIVYRIKTADSIKEKIIRNGLYKNFQADKLIYCMSDVIGLRVECRFLNDEKKLYEKLKSIFTNTDGRIFYGEREDIKLKLGTPQPEKQKNGLDIYRIDGIISFNGRDYNFELQIKSLVNNFWGEIEHKIIYKNKRVMMDNFVSELMSTINLNLINVDRQLNMLFTHWTDANIIEQTEQINNLLTMFINEVYSSLIETRTGFTVSIKRYSESLVKYLLSYSRFKSVSGEHIPILHMLGATGTGEQEANYANIIVSIMRWMRSIEYDNVGIGEKIELNGGLEYKSPLEHAVGEKIISNINDDFFVNTFFHILFSLEQGSCEEAFKNYVAYYVWRIAQNKTAAQTEKLKNLIAIADPSKMLLESEIKRLDNLKENNGI